MIAELKPYPAMKDSGVLWLGEVPEHWELAPNRILLRRRKVLVGSRHSEYRLLSLTKQGVIVRDVENGRGKFSADMGTSQEVRAGDLIFCLFDIPETPRTVGLSHHDGMITGAYTVFQCFDALLAAYLDLYYRAMDDRKLLSPLYSGLRHTIPPTRFLGIKSPVPPPAEQAAIVRFLDHADRRIRRYIRTKQKLIKLLEEQKQTIIHRAVTRGLDPNVRLKPSGVEWLREIPCNWKSVPLKRLLSRIDYGTSEASKADGRIRVLTMGNIQKGEVTVPSSGGLDEVSEDLLLENNDLLFTRTNGNPNLVGKVGIFRGQRSDKVSFASYLVRLRAKQPNDPRWLHMLLNSALFWPFARSHALVNLQTNLNSTRYCQFSIPVPPSSEQIKIFAGVGNESRSLDTAIACAVREIAVIREYRTRLIADVVTGKLDVRKVAARLPDEVDELESLDEAEADADVESDFADELDTVPEEAEA